MKELKGVGKLGEVKDEKVEDEQGLFFITILTFSISFISSWKVVNDEVQTRQITTNQGLP